MAMSSSRMGLWVPVLVLIIAVIFGVMWSNDWEDTPRAVPPAPGETPVLATPQEIPSEPTPAPP
jgi:hypothetical protein